MVRHETASVDMGKFYKLRTFHDSLVAEDRATGEVTSVAKVDIGLNSPALVVYVPKVRPDTCFLISERVDRLWLPPTLEGSGILPLGLARDLRGTVSLYDPDTGKWACATPLEGTNPPRGRLVLGRRKVNAFERLTLLPMQPVFVPSIVVEKATRLEAMLALPLNLDLIRAVQPEHAAVLQAIARLASLSQLEELTRELLGSPEDCLTLGRLFPEDIMGKHGLPRLVDWLERRDASTSSSRPIRRRGFARLLSPATPSEPAPLPTTPVFEQTLGVELDGLSSLGFNGEYVSLPHACTALARRSVTPRQDLCIVATARNEGLYILEWLAYHRAIGVQAFFLYTNDNDDGSDQLLSVLARAGVLHWARNQLAAGSRAQGKAYGHALALQPEILDYRWALIIDLDEYFVMNPALFYSALDFLRWHEAGPCDAIALNWVMHGSVSSTRWREEFIMQRFPYPTGNADLHIKTFCRPRCFIHSTPHYPVAYRHLPFTFRAANGEPHAWSESAAGPAHSARPDAEFAWINHYFFKSSEEFLWKWSRNRASRANQRLPTNKVLTADFVRSFMKQFSHQREAKIHSGHYAERVSHELTRLMSLPGVAEAWAHVKQTYAERIQTIVPMFVDAPGITEAGDVGRAFLATLGL